MYIEILGIIIVVLAFRALITRNRAEKLLYINVIDFAIAALFPLIIKTDFIFLISVVFFICSTISSNAIAYSLNRLDKEIILDGE